MNRLKRLPDRTTDAYKVKLRLVAPILKTAVLLLGFVATTEADTITLDFNSLPSEQGWTYRGTPLTEQEAYTVDGASLSQSTVGAGGTTASYRIENIVNSSEPMTLSFTARVTGYEIVSAQDAGRSFYFQIYDRAVILQLGISDGTIFINGENFELDTSEFHDYLWEYSPGGDFQFFVDGQLRASGNRLIQSGDNFIWFGDRSVSENADVEITNFAFSVSPGAAPDIDVQKSVDNSYPSANEPVEFTVEVRNVGVGTAPDLVVIDQLPREMMIPVGMGAFTSIGTYDPASGEWLIGDLDEGFQAVLVVPAVITDEPGANCIANFAVADHPRDFNQSNDIGSAVVHRDATDHCVDLDVQFAISADSNNLFPSCDSQDRYSGDATITNLGPDAARNVVVTISQSPVVGPNLRFDDADCSSTAGPQCAITEIAPGQSVTIDVTSDLYQSYNAVTQTISVNAVSSDVDFDPSNNSPSVSGSGGGFSQCIDFGLPAFSVGPGGGCFIATAAYGSVLHSDLDVLRNFRDRFLLTNRPGRAFVEFYYEHSPPMADFIAERDWLRAIIRLLLAPIVYSIKYPGVASILIIGAVAAALMRRRWRLSASRCAV